MIDFWAIAQPSSLLILTVLAAFVALAFRRVKLAGVLCAVALLLLAIPTAFDLAGRLAWELERRVEQPEALPERIDGILVLGGSVEWQTSRRRGQLNLNAAGERMLAAAALARRYPEARLAFTGVYREDIANDFIERSKPGSLIFGPEFGGRSIEFIGAARSTYEDALLALERLSPRSGETWLLVTSAMHMPRAEATFRHLGWRLLPYPVDFRTSGAPDLLESHFRPGAALAALDEVVREWGAILVYDRTGRIDWP